MNTTRRQFLARSATALVGVGALLLSRNVLAQAATALTSPESTTMPTLPTTITPIVKTEAEWQAVLSPAAFNVLRKHGTERSETSPLNLEKRAGIYTCGACALPVFSSAHKFESGTGWPSFYQPIAPQVIGTRADKKLWMTRTEVHCARCQGHLGHVFEDGPAPTGLRYCLNGVALGFVTS